VITKLPIIRRVIVENSERLYPNGIDWILQSGVNALIGGTALGKTTLIYAIQFAVFGRFVVEGRKATERIEKEFFRNRMSKRKGAELEKRPPTIQVWFSVGERAFNVRRNLLTGILLEVELDGKLFKKVSSYQDHLAGAVGLEKDFSQLTRLQAHLLFFGEGQYLVAWENLLQNELLNVIFADNDRYRRLGDLWEQAQSADSSARNFSAQAARYEKDLEVASIEGDKTRQLDIRSAQSKIQTLQTIGQVSWPFEVNSRNCQHQRSNSRM